MSLPFYISKRYTLSKKDSRFITFISSISIIGIALGVATLIIALSILNGFEETLTKKIIDFDAHIKITSYKNTLPHYKIILPVLKEKLFPYATDINPYASNLAIIGSKKIKEGVSIKGINLSDNWPGLKRNIIEGNFVLGNAETPQIIIGKKLANKLYVKVGDKVTVFALKNNRIPSPDDLPNIQRFEISAIFESGMAEYDDQIAYVSLQSAQKLFSI